MNRKTLVLVLVVLVCVAYFKGRPMAGSAYVNLAGLLNTHAQSAIPRFDRAVAAASRIAPSDYQVFLVGGMGWLLRGEDQRAVQAFRNAADLSGGDRMALYWLGQTYLGRGDVDDAIPVLVQSGAGPTLATARIEAGQDYQAKKSYDLAEREYRLAIGLDPHLPLGYFWLGELFRASGRADQALAQYSKAIQADAQFVEGYLRIADLYHSKRQDALADEWYLRATAAAPARSEPWLRLANSKFGQGEMRQAADYFEKAAILAGDDVTALYWLDRSNTLAGRSDQEVLAAYCRIWKQTPPGSAVRSAAGARIQNGSLCP